MVQSSVSGEAALTTFWERYAFSVADADFQWIDVALGAMVRGEWPAFERVLAEGLACAARAGAEGTWPDDDVVDAAATAFRYDRDLIAASEMSAWLERYGLSSAEWIAWISRDVMRRTRQDDIEDTLDRYPPSPRQLTAAAVAEGICSGTFERFELALAGRAAFVFASDRPAFDRARTDVASFDVSASRLMQTHRHWLAMRPAPDTHARLATILSLEAACGTLFERVGACPAEASGEGGSNGQLADVLEAHRLEWVQVELETVSFDTEDAAREAMLCVRCDGLTLHDVAGLARRSVARATVLLQDLPPDRRDVVLAAEPGQILGPQPADGSFDVIGVVGRTVPSLADVHVATRARQTLIDTLVHRAARDHVVRR